MPASLIRSYQKKDRPSVRKICCDTADCGRPVERFFSDRELFADAVTLYYTDITPATVWIVESGGQVAGYLTGCLDTRGYSRTMKWRIGPRLVLRCIMRGEIFRPATWRLFYSAFQTWRKYGFHRHVDLRQYPAHFHINLISDFRGQHIGRRLLERFSAHAAEAGSAGIHLVTRSDNENACRFFEKMGFTELERHPVVLPNGKTFQTHQAVIYGKKL